MHWRGCGGHAGALPPGDELHASRPDLHGQGQGSSFHGGHLQVHEEGLHRAGREGGGRNARLKRETPAQGGG